MNFTIALENPHPDELAALMAAVGWGVHEPEKLSRSIGAYTAIVCARDAQGLLVGHASVFSDGVFTTMFGELIVHPSSQRQGVGTALLNTVGAHYPLAPIYVKALGASHVAYPSAGFKVAGTPVTSMFKKPRFFPVKGIENSSET